MKAEFSVQTPSKNYPLFIRPGLKDLLWIKLLKSAPPGRVFIVVDQNVEQLHGEELRKMAADITEDFRTYVLPAGESSKNYEHWKDLTDFLLNNGARRNTPVFAIGGGVTGDLAGFAAATVLRGLPLIHIPTTLLAMVDSSIGGKTGINHEMGKNLLGSFYQPDAILINTGFLSTLPRNEWINGLSEILKYAAIKDETIFQTCKEIFLEKNHTAGHPLLEELIRKCAKIKADVVAADEKESGLRMILNFGHTFAHALENNAEYKNISHGEAVFIGMVAATRLSNILGASIDIDVLEKFRYLYEFDPSIGSYQSDDLIRAMYSDKKRMSENLKFVLLQDWADPYVTECREIALISDAWSYALDLIKSNK
jgi:3-dehydroquinate synthase